MSLFGDNQDHQQGTSFMWFIENICCQKPFYALADQGEEAVPNQTMWAAIELAKQRQQLFEEDRSGANALSRGRGKKKKNEATEATEATEAGFNHRCRYV